jgi:hypothetical protein
MDLLLVPQRMFRQAHKLDKRDRAILDAMVKNLLAHRHHR